MTSTQYTQIKITSPNIKDIEKRLGALKNKAPNVLSNVLNRVISRVKTLAPKEITNKYKISRANFIKWVRYSKVTKSNLNAYYSARSYPLSISEYYKSKPNKFVSRKGLTIDKIKKKFKGVKTQVEKGHGFILHKKAFIAVMKNKTHEGVFRSIGNRKIEEIKGPSAASILGNKEILEKIDKETKDVYNKRIEHEINRLLGR